MSFPRGKSERTAIPVGYFKDAKTYWENAQQKGPIRASRTSDTASPLSSCSDTVFAPKFSSSTVFEPATPFAPTQTSTAALPKKWEKYHCAFCLDAFPYTAQRDMHEINKHSACLYHPSFLSLNLPDRISEHDW